MGNRLTIMCCYNDKKQIDCFWNSLNEQSERCDLVLIDNCNKKYRSCSEAFNRNLEKVGTEYVVFSHQDIIFNRSGQLEKFMEYLIKIGTYDILGVAGGKRGERYTITNLRHGKTMDRAGARSLTGIQEVDVIDECFFGGTTKCFKDSPFDEKLCPGWHLYAVERSLAALLRGDHVYVCDMDFVHKSKGKINHAYNVDFYRVSKKYSHVLDYLKTTCAYARTEFPYREWSYLKREISVMLGRY